MSQLMPLPLTVSCFCKIQIGFTFLVPAHPGSPGKGPSNGCVCVCVFVSRRRRSGSTRPFLLASSPGSFVKVSAGSLEVEETALSLDDDGTAAVMGSDVAAFTADVRQQTLYWVDSVSHKMWSSSLTDSHHSVVCYRAFIRFVH